MNRIFRIAVLAALGTLLAASARYHALVRAEPPAPELESSAGWLNTDRPLRLGGELKGHVVLLDFWTYCCINCMHVLPDLEYLEEKYQDEPFVVIGVHSAKFRNESERESIRQAIFRYGIRHPVIIDSASRLWNAYKVQGWPSFVVIGADGRLVPIHNRFGTPLFTASGEGHREALDQAIAKAIDDARSNGILASRRVEFMLDAAVASASGLSFPGKVSAVAPREGAPGYVFISDSSHHRVLVASWPALTDGRAMSRLLWTLGTTEAGLADGSPEEARFHNPQGMSFDPRSRTLYVADTDNHAVRAVDLGMLEGRTKGTHAVVRTIAGDGKQSKDLEVGKRGRDQRFASPWDVLVSPEGSTLYVAMAGAHQIWTIDLETHAVAAFAGSGAEELRDGPAADAALAQPSGLSMTPDGSRLYFADSETSSIRYVDMRTRAVHTLVGHGLFDFGDVSNTFARTRFQHCLGVSVLPHENEGGHDLLVADTYNHKIKRIDVAGGRVHEFLGVGRMKKAGGVQDLILDEPGGVCLVETAHGPALFIADTNNHRVLFADPETKEWHELVIEGLEVSESPREDVAVGARTIRAKAGETLRLDLAPRLEAGKALNAEAPIGIRVTDEDGAVMHRTVRAAAFPVSIEIPGSAVRAGARLRIDITFATCTKDDEGLCAPEAAAWDVTIEHGEGPAATLD